MSKKKVGILTIHDSTNYGATLQAFALNKFINGLGYDCEVVDYQQKELIKYTTVLSLLKISWASFPYKSFIRRTKLLISLLLSIPAKYRKIKSFERFCDNYIIMSKPVNNTNEIVELGYTDLVCGSDQIWNPEITNGIDGIYFADVPKNDINKVSYAASIGMEKYNENDELIIKKLIEKMNYCSVREEQSAAYLRSVTEKAIFTVVDPVFLLDASVYASIAKMHKIKYRYIFVYYVTKNELLNKIAKKVSILSGCKIIEVTHDGTLRCDNAVIDFASPQKFLGYLLKADYVVSNSFHGLAFSIIMGKQFFAVNNSKRGSRITDLLEMTNLSSRLYESVPEIMPQDIDYDVPHSLLRQQTAESKEFLLKALQ